MMRIVGNPVPTPTGWRVPIETPNAYTDGSSRMQYVDVRREDALEKPPEQLRALVFALADGEGFPDLTVASPTAETDEAKAKIEERLDRTVEDWKDWQWRIDHIAQYPAYAALTQNQKNALLAALTQKRDNAAARDWAVLQEWRAVG